jgi:cytochrome c oxidase subunit II
MPPPVRRSFFVVFVTCSLALVAAGTALAGNGGVAPPAPASPNAQSIRDVYWLILGVTGGIFVLVTAALLIFVVRYRSRGRPRDVEGPQVRGHTNLELAWTAGPVLLLAIIVGFVFWKVSDLSGTSGAPAAAASAQTESITIDAHQYYWEFVYPNGAISVDRLRLPYNRTVRLTIVAHDVDHSWWVPALGGKLDAIPGKRNHTTLRATKLGTFRGQCAEFCGLLHAAMLAQVEVLPADRYDSWVAQRKSAPEELGKETFTGVCAKCHGLAGQGDIGPDISASRLFGDRRGITDVIRNGVGKMPAVGQDWPQRQLDATIAYLKNRFNQGGSGGGQG